MLHPPLEEEGEARFAPVHDLHLREAAIHEQLRSRDVAKARGEVGHEQGRPGGEGKPVEDRQPEVRRLDHEQRRRRAVQAETEEGRMPKPKHIGKRVVWDRLKLDAAFADLDEGKGEKKKGGGGKRAAEPEGGGGNEPDDDEIPF